MAKDDLIELIKTLGPPLGWDKKIKVDEEISKKFKQEISIPEDD